MFNLSSEPKTESPTVFTLKPEFVRRTIGKHIESLNAVIAASETLLSDPDLSPKQQKLAAKFIEDEHKRARQAVTALSVVGEDPIDCNFEEFNVFMGHFSELFEPAKSVAIIKKKILKDGRDITDEMLED